MGDYIPHDIEQRLAPWLGSYMPQHTTFDTICAMRRFARKECNEPHVTDLVLEICGTLPVDDKLGQMRAINSWILSNLQYVLDEHESAALFGTEGDLELLKSPIAVLKTGTYDCDCIATFIASLFLALGIRAQFVVVGFHSYAETGPEGWEHVFVQALDPASGKWVCVDPVSAPNEEKMLSDVQQRTVYDV